MRVNYEHKGGRLTCEAHYRKWGARQIKGCRAVIRANLADLSFVVIRLLNARGGGVQEDFANLTGCSVATAMKTVRPWQGDPGERVRGRRFHRPRKMEAGLPLRRG